MMERVIFASRAEEGCITYAYSEDVLEPGLFRVTEIWTGRAALDAHFQTEHMQLWQQERAQLGMTDRQITAITVKDSEAL